ncbi:MAG: hypothetical protein GKR99_02070 [Rhodobacteraceae bacterium]|nr:hypothetical protein [Paracoccaceae bacterium]
MEEGKLERYRQRYETWRHLDKIRYQIIQASIALLAAGAVVINFSDNSLPFWFFLIVGLAAMMFWKVLYKVNDAIIGNGQALRDYGAAIGDEDLPDVSDRKASVFYYIEVGYLISAAICFLVTIFIFLSAL